MLAHTDIWMNLKKAVCEARIGQLRKTGLANKGGRPPQGNKQAPAVRQDCRSVFNFHSLSQFSPTAPPPLATQCDFHLFFTVHSLPPSIKKAINVLDLPAQ